jgi:hypothetical protein
MSPVPPGGLLVSPLSREMDAGVGVGLWVCCVKRPEVLFEVVRALSAIVVSEVVWFAVHSRTGCFCLPVVSVCVGDEQPPRTHLPGLSMRTISRGGWLRGWAQMRRSWAQFCCSASAACRSLNSRRSRMKSSTIADQVDVTLPPRLAGFFREGVLTIWPRGRFSDQR